jgi:hypothetical protein
MATAYTTVTTTGLTFQEHICGAVPLVCRCLEALDVDGTTGVCPVCCSSYQLDELEPCSAPATTLITDADGDAGEVCIQHARLWAQIHAAG